MKSNLNKFLVALLTGALMCSVSVYAQTDCTSLITNPSFEQGTDGWEHEGMNAQTNSVFSIKSGNTYMERWTGVGGAVGNGKLSQVLYKLSPGNYELTAAAQNIQEGPSSTTAGGAATANSPTATTFLTVWWAQRNILPRGFMTAA